MCVDLFNLGLGQMLKSELRVLAPWSSLVPRAWESCKGHFNLSPGCTSDRDSAERLEDATPSVKMCGARALGSF